MSHKNQNWVLNGDVEKQDCAPGVARQIMAYCDELMCVINYFETGAVGAMHQHPHTQITYVAEGEFEFTIGDETRIVKKGDTLLKQNSIIHGCVCREKGALVDFFTPKRDDFVAD